jgi:AcrR family transcriptional regulator
MRARGERRGAPTETTRRRQRLASGLPAVADLRSLRRAQIVAAARVVIAKGGLEALTFAGLEKQLGYTRGVMTYHFKNKSEIVDAVLASAVDAIDRSTRAEVAAAHGKSERAAALVRAVVRGFVTNVEAVRVLFAFWGLLHAEPRIRAVNAKLYARYRRQTREVLGGDDAMAPVIVAVVLGIVAQWYFDPGALDVDAAVEEAVRAVAARLARRG